MGVRKKLHHCTHCTKLIDGKAYRLKINGDEAAMHVNCVYAHWHKTYINKGIPLPALDKKQHASMTLDVTDPSYGKMYEVDEHCEWDVGRIGPQP